MPACSSESVTADALRKKLLELVKQRGKDYGIIVRQVQGSGAGATASMGRGYDARRHRFGGQGTRLETRDATQAKRKRGSQQVTSESQLATRRPRSTRSTD